MINTYSPPPKFLETYILSLKYQTCIRVRAEVMSLACFVIGLGKYIKISWQPTARGHCIKGDDWWQVGICFQAKMVLPHKIWQSSDIPWNTQGLTVTDDTEITG